MTRSRIGTAALAALCLLGLSACDFPRDPAGTSDRIAERGTLIAGIVAGPDADAETALAETLARSAQVRLETRSAAGEELMRALDRQQVDVVVGPFAAKTPWASAAGVSPPAERTDADDDVPVLRALVKGGENGFLMKVGQWIKEARR